MASVCIELKEQEPGILNELAGLGLFGDKSEVMRSAIIKYAIDLWVFRKKSLWDKLNVHHGRNVTPGQLKIDLEELENEVIRHGFL